MYLYKPHNRSVRDSRVSDDIKKIKKYLRKYYEPLEVVFEEGKNQYLKDNNIIMVKYIDEYNEEQHAGSICNIRKE